jgi:mediator of RNA polymerase II transcription subunit 12, fungi type
MVHESWEKNNQLVLSQLGDLMSEVFVRRNRMQPSIGSVISLSANRRRKKESNPLSRSSTYKPPERRTIAEARKIAWIADLANPDVPLSRLGTFVPAIPRGPDLLDLLEANHVPTPRAVWYIRVIGSADLVSSWPYPLLQQYNNANE